MKLKFISLNLYEGGLLFEEIIDFLRQENPDIFVVQEVNNSVDRNLPQHLRSIQILSENFPTYNYSFAPEILMSYPEGKIDIGNAIFSKFPVKQTSTTFLNVPYGEYDPVPIGGDFSHHPKNMQWCEIQVGEQKINVFNLHGLWELSGNDTPDRLKMSEIIVNEVIGKEKVILGGDFNLKPNTQTIKNIEKHLSSVFGEELKSTFNLKRKDLTRFPGYATAVVDMIFVSNDVQILSKNCPDVDVSDHLPLVCQLEI